MSTNQPSANFNRQILDEASDWFVDFRVGDADQQARERFDEWLRRSPEHIRAYMEIAKAYVVLPGLSPNRRIDVQELIAYARSDGNVVPFGEPTPRQTPAQMPPGLGLQRSNELAKPRRSWLLKSLAASIAMACIAASVFAWVATHRFPTYTTDIGERRSITLSDGSTIELNARSNVRVKFSKAERGVELVDGQALFEVAKEKARPFVVHSGAAVVRAVGTQFDVYRNKSGTTVTVVEGRVTVAHEGSAIVAGTPDWRANAAASPPRSPTFVSAGEQVTVTEREMATPKPANVAAATAWMEHRLIFDGARLSDVVEDLNRYNTRQIVIEDEGLQDFRISGVYSSTDPASLIRFLREQPGVRVIDTDEGVRITRQ
ncbi:MAG: FecR family protein [Steroidobacteraceae bacterium]